MSELDALYRALSPTLRDVDKRQLMEALRGLEGALNSSAGPRARILLEHLRFDGKVRGEFPLHPGVNVIRAGNDKGKSSVLKLIQLCLTGKNDLKKDVDSWIERVELIFRLDGIPHAVQLEKKGRPRGRLLREKAEKSDRSQGTGGFETVLEFKNAKEMRDRLEDFFNQAFGLRPLAGTQKDSRKGSDALLDSATSYRAFFRGLHINQDLGYTDLLTEGTSYGNLYLKILGTLLGLRGLEAYFAVEARRAHLENALGKEERYHRRVERSMDLPDLASLNEEVDRLESYIDDLKTRRSALYVRSASQDLDQRLAVLGEQILEADDAAQRKAGELQKARLRLEESEARLAELLASQAEREGSELCTICEAPVQEIIRGFRPAQCRCALSLTLMPVAPEDDDGSEAREIEDSIPMLRRRVARLGAENEDRALRHRQLVQEKRTLQAQLRTSHQSTAELDQEIELETRYLGRMEADRERASKLLTAEGDAEIKALLRQKTILDAVLRQLRGRDAESNERIKTDFSQRVRRYCTTIGFPNLEEIHLDAKLRPRIRQNGKTHTFEELSPGEKVRFVLAFHLALAIGGDSREQGNHPGLLLIDSPGKEEMVQGDFEAVVGLLRQIEEGPEANLQVLVASTIPAIAGATTAEKQHFVADDQTPLFN